MSNMKRGKKIGRGRKARKRAPPFNFDVLYPVVWGRAKVRGQTALRFAHGKIPGDTSTSKHAFTLFYCICRAIQILKIFCYKEKSLLL